MLPRAFLIVLIAIPCVPLVFQIDWRYGLAELACFGTKFEAGQLREIQPWVPKATSHDGYDGQFYLQLAIDPSLRHPGLRSACDNLAYRAQRIGMPALSYVLGLGQPRWIIQAYCSLNFVAWVSLLVWGAKHGRLETKQGRAVVFALLASSGVLFSVHRGLTDLPSLCLCLWAIQIQKTHPTGSGLLAAGSLLTKETALLSLLSFIRQRTSLFRVGVRLSLIAIPLVTWLLVLRLTLGSNEAGYQNFTWPMVGWLEKVRFEWVMAITQFPKMPIVEMLAPLCLAVQVSYLLLHANWDSPWWRMGIAFAVLGLFLAFPVWESQNGYTRVLLPMSCAFNLELRNQAGRRFYWWYWLGNAALFPRAIHGLVAWGIIEWIWTRKPADAAIVEPNPIH